MQLLYKELVLAAHPTHLVFACMGALVLVPAYPFSVIFMFGCLGPYITLQYGRETGDARFTALLPVARCDVVRGKFLLIACLQLFQLALSVPFACLRGALGMGGNPVGLDATVAWYGMGLMLYAVFDAIFLPVYYHTACKVGRAFLVAALPMVLMMAGIESVAHIPALAWMDGTEPGELRRQIPIFLLGVLAYGGALSLAYRRSVQNFSRVDL